MFENQLAQSSVIDGLKKPVILTECLRATDGENLVLFPFLFGLAWVEDDRRDSYEQQASQRSGVV
jgi:hypothetical protein